MELCNERFDHHVDYQVLKQNEMKKLAQEAIAQGDKVKYDRKQTQKLNVLLQRAKAPLQRSSYAEETECRRYRAASMSSNRVCSRNGDLPARSREDTYLKCFDANKAELNGEQSLRKGRVKLQVLRSFIINDDGDLEAGNTCADEGSKGQKRCSKLTSSGSTKTTSTSCSTATSTNSSASRISHRLLTSPKKNIIDEAEIIVKNDPAPEICPSPPTSQFTSSPFNAPHRRISVTSPHKPVMESVPNRLSDNREKECGFSVHLSAEESCMTSIGDCAEDDSTSVHDSDQDCPVAECSAVKGRRTIRSPKAAASAGVYLRHTDSKFLFPKSREFISHQSTDDDRSILITESGSAQNKDKGQHIWYPEMIPDGLPEGGVEGSSAMSSGIMSPVRGSLHGPVRRKSFKESDGSGTESDPRKVQFCHTDTWEYLEEHSSMDLDVLVNEDESSISDESLRDLNDVDGLSRMLSWRSIVESPAEYVRSESCMDRNVWPERFKSFPFGITTPVPLSLGGSCDVDEEDDEAFRSYEKSLQRDEVLLRKQLEIKLVRAARQA